ncbi:GTPase [Roseomonas xinghualingensis]|uniref:GTPase n=1 Tax=Roseomonas xinghualingensis TaxID=2986475 RepID=UPI0021F0E168|nr:GTPase domain-containing protein [Roseomonas sp. SXEYE001]MCV4208797.1 GTPase domain-containing protein [Roseomonas sp. SXEYE001]
MMDFLQRAWGALRGAIPGLFRSRMAAPDWTADRARILLVGPSGAGKSTLVNALLGEGTAEAGSGAPVTRGTTWYGRNSALPVALGDTRGLESVASADQVAALEAALSALAAGRRPHLVWLVINAEGGRAFSGAGTLGALAASLRQAGIPFLVVLTHAEPGEKAHAELRTRIAAVMGDVPIAAVNTLPLMGEDGAVLLPVHGVEALWRASLPFLPALAVRP